MKQAIIVHGKPSKQSYFNPNLPSTSNSIWIPWLQQQLLICGIDTQTPEMPESWRPDYSLWRQTFEKYDVNSETMLVGHSCGGGFLIQWMSENSQICAGDVYLVAPAFGDKFNPEAPYDEPLRGGFFDFEIDEALLDRVRSLTIFYSDNDSVRVDAAIKILKNSFPSACYRLFPEYGHFCGKRDMADDTFPELFETILRNRK